MSTGFNYNEDNPGPGAYYLNYKHVLLQAPKPSFGLRPDLWFDRDKPGPGTYNVRRDGNTSPKYTMAKHFDGPQKTNVPGPGTYYSTLKHTNIRVPAYSIQGKNNYNPDKGVPGPGTYDLREEIPDNTGYSLGKRFNSWLSTTPGPGHYSPKSPSGSPAYSIGQHLLESRHNTPGPGTYNLRSAEFSGPMYSMGKRFYRLREKKRERRYSIALKSRPNYRQGPHGKPATNSRGVVPLSQAPADYKFSPYQPKRSTVLFPRDFDVETIPALKVEMKRKHSHIHMKPEVPRREFKLSSKCAPGPECLPPEAGAQTQAPVEPIPPKTNAWMDVGKNLQRIRDSITAAALLLDPEPPPE